MFLVNVNCNNVSHFPKFSFLSFPKVPNLTCSNCAMVTAWFFRKRWSRISQAVPPDNRATGNVNCPFSQNQLPLLLIYYGVEDTRLLYGESDSARYPETGTLVLKVVDTSFRAGNVSQCEGLGIDALIIEQNVNHRQKQTRPFHICQ